MTNLVPLEERYCLMKSSLCHAEAAPFGLFCTNSIWEDSSVPSPLCLVWGIALVFHDQWKELLTWFSWSSKCGCRENIKKLTSMAKQALCNTRNSICHCKNFKLLQHKAWGETVPGSHFWTKTLSFSGILLKPFSLKIWKEKVCQNLSVQAYAEPIYCELDVLLVRVLGEMYFTTTASWSCMLDPFSFVFSAWW